MVGILKLGLLYLSMIGCGVMVLVLSGGLRGFLQTVSAIDNPTGVRFASLFARGIGKDGGAAMAARLDLPLLGRIPLVQSIRESGDAGEPVALGSRPDSLAFLDLARKLVDAVNA